MVRLYSPTMDLRRAGEAVRREATGGSVCRRPAGRDFPRGVAWVVSVAIGVGSVVTGHPLRLSPRILSVVFGALTFGLAPAIPSSLPALGGRAGAATPWFAVAAAPQAGVAGTSQVAVAAEPQAAGSDEAGATERAVSSRPAGSLVVVVWPGAERARWLDTDGVPGHRGIDRWLRHGWMLRPDDLSADEGTRLDAWVARAGSDLLWIGEEAIAVAPAYSRARSTGPGSVPAPRPRTGLLLLGSRDSEVFLRWEGVPAGAGLDRLSRETHAWLDGNRRLRWEEAVEILDLSSRENGAFQVLSDPANPFYRLRSTFVADKAAANLGIYLLGTRRPSALVWRLGLVRAFENGPALLARDVLATNPLPAAMPGDSLGSFGVQRLEQARNRLFCGRVLASRGRVYGRCDRILLSLAVEGARGALLIVDGRESADPFVAVLRVDDPLPAADRRGDLLADALRLRWATEPPADASPATSAFPTASPVGRSRAGALR